MKKIEKSRISAFIKGNMKPYHKRGVVVFGKLFFESSDEAMLKIAMFSKS